MAIEVIMPSLGEGVVEGTISSWLKKEGDEVKQYEPILEIETDKVTTEATAEVDGTLLKILISESSTVEVGTILAYIGEPGETLPKLDKKVEAEISGATSQLKEAGPSPVVKARSQPAIPLPATNGPPLKIRRYAGRISPVVGRIAEEHAVDLNEVSGTGRDGRITKKDILAFIERRDAARTGDVLETASLMSPTSKPDRSTITTAVPGEILSLSRMRQTIADHMVRSKHTSPHVTTVFDVDLSAVAAHLAANKELYVADGAKLTFTAYLVVAIVQALKANPLVNSTWTEAGIWLKKELNLGMATAIPDGLIVPVIKNADGLSLLGIARTIKDLSSRTRSNQLLPDEVQGGTFTLTNHGVSGSLFATPIINQPQCGILGVGKIEKRVKVIDDAIAIRLMAYASFTFDHRILDGATADAFMTTFKDILETWS